MNSKPGQADANKLAELKFEAICIKELFDKDQEFAHDESKFVYALLTSWFLQWEKICLIQ